MPNLPTFNYFPSLHLQKGQLFPLFIWFHAHVFHRPRLMFLARTIVDVICLLWLSLPILRQGPYLSLTVDPACERISSNPSGSVSRQAMTRRPSDPLAPHGAPPSRSQPSGRSCCSRSSLTRTASASTASRRRSCPRRCPTCAARWRVAPRVGGWHSWTRQRS